MNNISDSSSNYIRIQKFFTDNGVLSRRATESAIQDGRVFVNGIKATIGQKIDPEHDEIVLDGKIIVKRDFHDHVYIMLHKPIGFVTTTKDEKGRQTVLDLTKDVKRRIYPVGRLDLNSCGLLLLTDDGDLTLRLTHPKHEIPKIYHVMVGGIPTPAQLKILSTPCVMDGILTSPAKVHLISSSEGNNSTSLLEITIHEGRNHQIRRLCENASLSVRSLKRIAVGKVQLGDLAVGKWRHLTPDEISYLKGTTHHVKGITHTK